MWFPSDGPACWGLGLGSDVEGTTNKSLSRGGARELADSLGLWKRPEMCEAKEGVAPPHFPWDETLFSSLVSATSDPETEDVCPSIST